jgi:hypothetical protein
MFVDRENCIINSLTGKIKKQKRVKLFILFV